jgi:hypothetical protein
MSHIQYEEEQRFTNLRWIWVLVAFILLFLILVFTLDEGARNRTGQLFITLGAALIPIVILVIGKLQIRVDCEGFHYKFFPRVLKWRHIRTEIIDSYEVKEKRTLYERFGCGYKRNHLTKTIFMNITGTKFIHIRLNDGKKMKIGSVNAEGIERALRKLTTTTKE